MAAILGQKELDARAQAGLVAQPGQEWGTKGDMRQDSPQPLHKESRAGPPTGATGSQESGFLKSKASATKSQSCVSGTSNTASSTSGSG